MRFHHMCIMCKDIVSYTKFWTDVMEFKAIPIVHYPTPPQFMQHGGMSADLCDEIFGRKGHELDVTFVIDREGAALELNSPKGISLTPAEELRYTTTGVHELGLTVDDIDHWFKKIVDAGFETTTSEPWSIMPGGINRTFLFSDPEGNLIQLTQVDDGDYWNSLMPHTTNNWQAPMGSTQDFPQE